MFHSRNEKTVLIGRKERCDIVLNTIHAKGSVAMLRKMRGRYYLYAYSPEVGISLGSHCTFRKARFKLTRDVQIRVGKSVLHARAGKQHRMEVNILSGPRRNQTYKFHQPIVRIGRSEAAEIQINDMTLSDLNSKLELVNGELYLSDLSSSNGTYICPTGSYKPLLLEAGDKICMGEYFCVVRGDIGSKKKRFAALNCVIQ